MLFGPKKINTVGLDISDSSIKVMQLARHHGYYVPSAYSNIDVPNNLIANHVISDEQKMADYILRAIKSAKFVNTKYVVASVPEAKSFVRILKMPKMDTTEIGSAIPWELEQDIPIPIEQVYLDWQLVKEDTDANQVLVVATPKDYIDALVSSLKLAKLRPVAFELESMATARALISADDLDMTTLVVDMSTTITSFVIVSGKGVIEYTSNIPTGGNHITENISKTLGISLKEAEDIKRSKGLTADVKKGNIRQAMLPILDNIIDEIRNVVKYHADHSSLSGGVRKLVLSGGAANLQGLADYVTARINLGADKPIDRIVLGDTWVNVMPESERKKLKVSPEESLAYSTAVGLALRKED
ncbi:MAG TPA: type IV pilus assembly protein PilM [Candidatus Binatia bacterium]|nr:type IV pilus assembly protein PilM [Candidatus Binatia bacterium]